MENNTPQYYINYQMFTGDEYTGESTRSGHILGAENDQDAIESLRRYVSEQRNGEVTRINKIKNVTGDLRLITDAISTEVKGLTETQKYNMAWLVIHGLNSKM